MLQKYVKILWRVSAGTLDTVMAILKMSMKCNYRHLRHFSETKKPTTFQN
jgi:hypothetical protein